jgi:hypothetical protein
MFKLSKEIKLLIFIFLLALFLRTYQLSTFPFGFHADEARVAWNALSILKTGKDDRGNSLALYYNTFGDFRPTGIFYVTIPSIMAFGQSEFAVRFPSALFGALTVFPLFFLVKELSKSSRKLETENWKLETLAALLLALSPWHIAVSRATNETVIALFFTLLGFYFFLKLIKEDISKYLILSFLFIFISYFFYHSARLLSPLFLILTAYYFRSFKIPIFYLIGGTLLLTFVFGLNPSARGRLSQVSILKDVDVAYEVGHASDLINNNLVIYTKRFINEYTKYFGADFLIGYTAKPYRYITPGSGILTYAEFSLLILGLIIIIQKKFPALPLLLLLAAPLPAALTTEDSPNLVRAFYMTPFIIIIASWGLSSLRKYKVAALALLVVNFGFFLYMYFTHSYIHRPLVANADMDASSYRNIGAKELVLKLDQVKNNYEKIIVTGFPDNLRPWYGFFAGKVPENIYLTDLKCGSDDSFVEENPQKLLAVDSWQCSPESKIKDGLLIKVVDKIKRPDGSDVYVLLERIK